MRADWTGVDEIETRVGNLELGLGMKFRVVRIVEGKMEDNES